MLVKVAKGRPGGLVSLIVICSCHRAVLLPFPFRWSALSKLAFACQHWQQATSASAARRGGHSSASAGLPTQWHPVSAAHRAAALLFYAWPFLRCLDCSCKWRSGHAETLHVASPACGGPRAARRARLLPRSCQVLTPSRCLCRPNPGIAAPTVSFTGRLLQRQLAAGRLANPGWVLGTASGGQVVLGILPTTKLPTSSQGWLAQNTVSSSATPAIELPCGCRRSIASAPTAYAGAFLLQVKVTGSYSGYTFVVSSAEVIKRNSGGGGALSNGAQKALVYALTVCGQSALDPATGRAPATTTVWDYLLNSVDSLGATWKRCSFGKVAFDASVSTVQTIDVGCQYGQPQYVPAACFASALARVYTAAQDHMY